MEIRPSADLRNCYPEISRICKEQNEPVFLTVNGRGDTVVMSMDEYKKQQEKLDLLEKLLAAKDDIINNRLFTHEQVFGELRERIEELKSGNNNV